MKAMQCIIYGLLLITSCIPRHFICATTKPMEEMTSLEFMYSDPEDIVQFSQKFLPKDEAPLDKAADLIDQIVTPIESIEEEGEKAYVNFKNELKYIGYCLLVIGGIIIILLFSWCFMHQMQKRRSMRNMEDALSKRITENINKLCTHNTVTTANSIV